MKQLRDVTNILVTRVISLLIFLILIGLLNFLLDFFDNSVFSSVVYFLNFNFGLVMVFWVLFLFGDLFYVLVFPLDLPAPIFHAIGSSFLVLFVFRIFSLLEDLIGIKIGLPVDSLYLFVTLIVFISVFIVGYFRIFDRIGTPRTKAVKKARARKKELRLEQKIKNVVESSIEDIKRAVE
ncbi:hypothetical protein HOD75_00930 [archaeon]|jgi:hypothetical protein|nr:hypothetical protein [archaeon]MBT4241441.1 hypothetical protein [archaeon]MBT4417688.1 hypothetical protein [archaeon]